MSWWGNSLEKAVGFSNIATNALKKAQKKIDKVLDIPIEEDLSNNTGAKLRGDNGSDSNVDINEIPNDQNIQAITTEFSDIDLTSPRSSTPIFTTANIEQLCDVTEQVCQRLGDWNTEDSLTASQFVNFSDHNTDKPDMPINEPCEFIVNSEKILHAAVFDQNPQNEDNQTWMCSNRDSHLSISSDCTTSTIKRCTSDIDSSGHTDDFNFTTHDEDSDVNNKEYATNDEVRTEEEDIMNESFKRVSEDPVSDEHALSKESSANEFPKFNLSIHEPLSVICPNKDDMDSNTTSSDIELVSCTTSNNGDNQLPSSQLSSSRFFIADYNKHTRSASGSSISICKIDNIDYPTDPEHFSNQLIDCQKHASEMSRLLDIRESKIIQLSRENIDLRDTISSLTRQIEQINERQETDATDINALTREFTTRLSEAEKRYQAANKERDQLRKQLTELERTESQQIEKVIKEKEEQLASLLQEGEKLAQDQLKANNTIKKLRNNVKEKETENVVLGQKITKLESEISHLKKVLDNKEDNERKHIEGITQLTKAVEKMEKENLQFTNINEVLQERNRSLESSLDKSAHDVANFKKHILELESKKMAIQNQYQILLDQQSNKTETISDIKTKSEHNEKEVSLLQKRLQGLARESSYKEEEYNSRISYLQERLAEMEQRNEELSEAASVATRPVIRQLEAIQNACATHTSNWERIENNLNSKIMDLQQRLSLSEETSQTYKDQLQSRDIQSGSIREEKNRILNQYNEEYRLRQLLVDEKIDVENKLLQFQQESKKEKDSYMKRIKDLEYNLLDVEHSLEIEKQNSINLSSKLNSLQMIMNQRQVNSEKPGNSSRRNSNSSTINDLEPDDSISMVSNISPNNSDRRKISTSLYDGLRQQGVAVMMEHLEASLKQKEGQINKLQTELENLRRSRENVIEEMTKLTVTIEGLESTVKSQECEIASMSDLNDRYNALLQMYGEKMEECEELRMDISEVKAVYRAHIDMLSQKSS